MSNSLDPDQAQYAVGPTLGPNSLQMLKNLFENFRADMKKNQHIWSLVILFQDCSNYANL